MNGLGIRVLVAEDEPVLRSALGEMLVDNGFVVTGLAANGAEAVLMARSSHPDVALLDLRMPIVDGLQATKEIKRDQPRVQVLILSAYEDSALQTEAEDAGVYCYLVKGTSPQLVMEMLRMAKAFGEGSGAAAPMDWWGQDGPVGLHPAGGFEPEWMEGEDR